MSDNLDSETESSIVEVRTYFVRGRNALVARADFEPLYIDYYLHLADHGLRYNPQQDVMLKEALAALTLHLASRPQDEGSGWTMNFNEPLMNLFVTGSTRPGKVTGRIFTEDVRDSGQCLFIAQTTRIGAEPSQSMIEFEGTDVLRTIEKFYSQSEQRLTRLFRHGAEDIVMVSAQPDCDEEWLAALTDVDIRVLDEREQLSHLETRRYVWECGCSIEKLYPLLASLGSEDLREAFGDEEILAMTCPRCAARYKVSREQYDAWRSSGAL